jgi:hypothetical protein
MRIVLQVIPAYFRAARRDQVGERPRAERKQTLVCREPRLLVVGSFTAHSFTRGSPGYADLQRQVDAGHWAFLLCGASGS